jgi:hypothetical protein
MIAYAAIALPFILTVMGVALALKPPQTPRSAWVWFAAFLVAGVLAIGTTIKDRINTDAAQEVLKDTVNSLKDAINKLTKPISNQSTAPARDPDAIYQNGNAVGRVTGARITLNESRVYFDQIENTGNLDRSKTFEYREYILRLLRADTYIGMLVTPSGVANNVYQHAVCEIVGRVR